MRRQFQCSSASRKFLNLGYWSSGSISMSVSVLFSEPKIPQFRVRRRLKPRSTRFSALQRAENSSIRASQARGYLILQFQCSSASRKFLNFLSQFDEQPNAERFSEIGRAHV